MRNDLIYFSEFVFPVCAVSPAADGSGVAVGRFHGTAFSIGNEGFFLSARHVVSQRDLDSYPPNTAIVGAPCVSDGSSRDWRVFHIRSVEQAPGRDVVIGKIDYVPPPFFSSQDQEAYG